MISSNENISLGKLLGAGMGSWVAYLLFCTAKVMLLWLFFTNTNKNQNCKCSFATQKRLFTFYRLEMY